METPPLRLAFTTQYAKRAGVLFTDIGVSKPDYNGDQLRKFRGVWDTGATNTVISKRVIDALGLKAVRTIRNQTANGEREAGVYIVDLYLPNMVRLQGQSVIDGLLADADVLIGMDVIGEGDFAVTHHGTGTCMTFQLPSGKHIDFVKEIEQAKPRKGFRQPKKHNRRR